MPRLYVSRVPFGGAWGIHRRARHPVLKLVFFVFALISFLLLLVVGAVVLVVDIVLLPFRLLLGLA